MTINKLKMQLYCGITKTGTLQSVRILSLFANREIISSKCHYSCFLHIRLIQ